MFPAQQGTKANEIAQDDKLNAESLKKVAKMSLRKKNHFFVYPKFNKNSKSNVISAWQVSSEENNFNELKTY